VARLHAHPPHRLGVPYPVLASGLIWGLWHIPLIVAGIYAAGPYPALSVV
jgi:CAAX protease family protein